MLSSKFVGSDKISKLDFWAGFLYWGLVATYPIDLIEKKPIR